MQEKRRPSVFAFLARRILIPVLTLWLLCMSLLTWAVARDFYLQLNDSVRDLHSVNYGDEDPVKAQYSATISSYHLSVERLLPIVQSHVSSDHWLYKEQWEVLYGFQSARTVESAETGLRMTSGDSMIFAYDGRYYYVDLDELGGGKAFADQFISNIPSSGITWFFAFDQISFTGYFEGNRFYPAVFRGYSYGLTEVAFSVPDPSREMVTIYPDPTAIYGENYEPGKPFRWKGKVYENAAALLDEAYLETGFGLLGSVIRLQTGGSDPVTTAIYCNPLEFAMVRTSHLWLISAAAVGIYLYWCLRRIQHRLTHPLRYINAAYRENASSLAIYGRSPLQEMYTLGQHFDAAQQDRHEAHNRVQQLQTALDYAREAEENRRRLVSAIAHELKTPLAVVHSYAEGLQAGIAGEKQDRYLQVLLEESEKMDGLVGEMLDYSRLEAGKVQLVPEHFSLSAETVQIFDRLSLSAQQRQLTVTLLQVQEFSVLADKGRIRQVITNFATNAIKYTTIGGNIRVRIFRQQGHGCVEVENDCPPLSQESLDHIWDSFYRADTARGSDGTGLGLAIVKSILTLHRGSCSVKNVDGGVQFSFCIPL